MACGGARRNRARVQAPLDVVDDTCDDHFSPRCTGRRVGDDLQGLGQGCGRSELERGLGQRSEPTLGELGPAVSWRRNHLPTRPQCRPR